MLKLLNKRALVTGGSSGIGQAIVLAYAKEGAMVIFSYQKNEQGAAETVAQVEALGGKARAIHANMADLTAVHLLLEESVNWLGGVDILVNNAGTLSRHADFLEIPVEEFDRIYEVNLRASFFLTQQIAKQMKQQNTGGSIIHISSMSAEVITPGLTHYECSKAAMNALTRGAASALAQYNIRVNAIAPGLVATNINKEQREQHPQAWERRSLRVPLGRVGQPEDIAAIALMLASKEAEWMTGAVVAVDGGAGVISPFA